MVDGWRLNKMVDEPGAISSSDFRKSGTETSCAASSRERSGRESSDPSHGTLVFVSRGRQLDSPISL